VSRCIAKPGDTLSRLSQRSSVSSGPIKGEWIGIPGPDGDKNGCGQSSDEVSKYVFAISCGAYRILADISIEKPAELTELSPFHFSRVFE
jgi:hypothetical protein